jgi:pimeloyl-ACP methyl ester carboxylesterase
MVVVGGGPVGCVYASGFTGLGVDVTILEQADRLVIFGGYFNFHPPSDEEYRRSKLVVRQMLSQFVDSPETVLSQYYKNSFFPQNNDHDTHIQGPINHGLLLSDLSHLYEDEHSRQRIFDLDAITILHGADDLIINKNRARLMYNELRYRSQYFEILKAGHAFPVTHAEKCIEILNPIMQP